MSKYPDGTPIELRWEDDPEFWAVRGHVEDSDAIAYASEWHDEHGKDEPERGYVVRHQWARWQMDNSDYGVGQTLTLFWQSGPGKFPVTVAHDGDEWHRIEESRREVREADERLRAWVSGRYADATVVDVSRRYQDRDSEAAWAVNFRVPACRYTVLHFEGSDDAVLVHPDDVDAWNAYRGHAPQPALAETTP